MSKKMVHRILDWDMGNKSYLSFLPCKVSADGRTVCFVFDNKVRYSVPVAWIDKWYIHPLGKLRVLRTRRQAVPFEKDWYFHVYLSFDNQTTQVVDWDHVLWGCEPNYEYFGCIDLDSKHIFEKFDPEKAGVKATLLHKDIDATNFGSFSGYDILDQGLSCEFRMPGGDRYRAALSTMLNWPVHIQKNTAPMNPDAGGSSKSRLRIIKCRRVQKKRAIRLYLSDGSMFDLGWELLLSRCDYRYENYVKGVSRGGPRVKKKW